MLGGILRDTDRWVARDYFGTEGRSMAGPEKRENSVLFSLRELRQIEENRVQEEEDAVRTASQSRAAAQEAEAARIRNAEAAKLQA